MFGIRIPVSLFHYVLLSCVSCWRVSRLWYDIRDGKECLTERCGYLRECNSVACIIAKWFLIVEVSSEVISDAVLCIKVTVYDEVTWTVV